MIKLYDLISPILRENLDSLTTIFQNKYPGLKLDVYNKNKYIYLSRIVVPADQRDHGVGTKFMLELIKHADIKKKIITLTPSTDFGGTSVSRLKRFYKRFGFVENKGKYKDYEISDSMYREPK